MEVPANAFVPEIVLPNAILPPDEMQTESTASPDPLLEVEAKKEEEPMADEAVSMDTEGAVITNQSSHHSHSGSARNRGTAFLKLTITVAIEIRFLHHYF